MRGRLLVVVSLLAAAAACKKSEVHHDDTATSAASTDASAADLDDSGLTASEPSADASVAGDGGDWTGPKIAALESPTPIFSKMEWPAKDPSKASEDRRGTIRLGYLRKGAIMPVKGEPTKSTSCTEGWYELLAGGYVCGKFVTQDLNHKELAKAPHAPFTDGPLPYEYGLNLTNGTPMYRRPPLRKERAEYERGLALGKKRKPKEGADPGTGTGTGAGDDNGGTSDKPWFLKDHGGQRPQVTMDDLKGESQLIEQRMVRGFYLGLDKEVSAFSGRMWRTTRGMYVPRDHVLVHKPKTEFEGVWMSSPSETRKLPLAWIVGTKGWKLEFDDANKRMKRTDKLDRFTLVQLTGKRQQLEGYGYHETSEGFWIRDADAAITRPGPAPKDLAPGEKWIDVNLSTQSIVAFEGDRPVFATIISSGRHNDEDPAKDHRTVQGTFRITEKHIAATMEADTASDGPYKIEDVPWIMYFEGSYALHGAFWHSSFGKERSHGCVNMQPVDAKAVFGWTGPAVPAGWHGVKSTDKNPGTRVIVHEDPKPKDEPGAPAASAAAKPTAKKSKPDAPKKSDSDDDG
jgi:hypothetical protein